jgi:hypothetical protein
LSGIDIHNNLPSLCQEFDINISLVKHIFLYQQTLPPNAWHYVCVATWFPLHEKHCSKTRCSVCNPAITSASAVCKKAGAKVNQKCIQKVIFETRYLIINHLCTDTKKLSFMYQTAI